MLSNHPNCLGGNGPSASSDLIGDVDGPASATDNAVARFDGTTGKLIQNSAVTIDDTGNITPSGSVHGANGSFTNPSFAFNSDQNTGLYRIGADNIGVAANGAKVLDIATTGLTVTGALGASSLTSPAATNLTLAGGSSGASLVLGQGATGAAAIAATSGGLRGLVIGASSAADNFPLRVLYAVDNTATADFTNTTAGTSAAFRLSLVSSAGTASWVNFSATHSTWAGSTLLTAPGSGGLVLLSSAAAPIDFYTNSSQVARLTATGNLLIGSSTSETGLTGSGGLKIASTTAGAANAGALVVAGGISAGNTGSAASYFGGGLTVGGAIYSSSFLDATGGVGTPVSGHGQFSGSGTYGAVIAGYGSTYDFALFNRSGVDVLHVATNTTTVAFSGAATFGGAVTATSASAHTFGTTNTVTMTAGDLTLNTGGKKVAFQNSGYENWAIGTRTATTQFVIDSTTTPLGAIFTNNGGLTLAGAVSAASLATAQTAAAATSIVITHKIPITLNGTVYYMALTATP